MQKAIFIGTPKGISDAYSEKTKAILNESLLFLPDFYTAETLRGDHPELKDVSYIFSTWGMAALTEEEIARLFPSLRAVFYAAGTVQAFARPFMKRGVKIFSAWGANAVPVAEYTVAQIILANKGFFRNIHKGGSPVWKEHDLARPIAGNFGTAVGIIGAGMIGTLVIKMLKNYNLTVRVFDPFMSYERAAELGVEKIESLPDLFASCHVITNHLANNPATVGMIDKKCFDGMDDNGVFLNTGRGAQVVEADLIAALKEKPERAAVLDVTWPEPPAAGSELYTMENVILSPHIAGSLGSEIQRMGEYMLGEYLKLTGGEATAYEVTEKMLETMA